MREALESLLIDGLDDWNDAGWIVSELFGPGIDDELTSPDAEVSPDELAEICDVVTTTVVELVTAGYVEVGEIDESRSVFVPWELAGEALRERILSDWRDLGRLPRLYELFWIRNTSLGDEVARAALDRDG